MKANRWILPEGIDEVLPPEARRLERLRRRLIDLYDSWGYDLVMPPMIEYLESLLVGSGTDLDLDTFKLVDQLNGRTMGVRADMTTQVARIDAHRLRRETPTRLCYFGTVLHTRPEGFTGARSPLQVGAELYGHAGIDSDAEVMSLMLETLAVAGVDGVHLDLGHVGIFRGLVKQANLDAGQEIELFELLQGKAITEIQAFLSGASLSGELHAMFMALPELCGDVSVLDKAKGILSGADAEVISAIDELAQVAARVGDRHPAVSVFFDLSELRGYHYHTGIVGAAFLPGHGKEIARGGRYDDIGASFGVARPATGFSTDLKALASFGAEEPEVVESIFAPDDRDAGLLEKISSLRAQGKRVVVGLPGQVGDAAAMECNQQLVKKDADWEII